jgi:hypothetical protein
LAGIAPLKTVPVTGPLLEPVDIFFTKDFGAFLMVGAANMKITIDKETSVIVNISGGGCPDVPYLAAEMVGRKLADAPPPRSIGHTLCGYALDLAYEEIPGSRSNGIIESIAEPATEALEAIGGTGDIITGLLSALIGAGKPIPEACISAACISRLAGQAAGPDPGTQVAEIIQHIPDILDRMEKMEIRRKKLALIHGQD